MKILLIGREGQIAWELQRALACLGEVVAVDRRSETCRVDLTDPQSVEKAVNQIRPQLVINAAAYTAVDRAEQETDSAHQINGIAPGILAEAAKAVGAGLIHYSTDYVFDGKANEPYSEEAITHPQSVYGKTKLLGEQAIQQIDLPYLILRTGWVYGGRGSNFLLTMLRLMKERDQLKIVDDQHGSPTWSRMIAEWTAQVVILCSQTGRFVPADRSGMYHISCNSQTTWYGFAKRIAEIAKQQGLLDQNGAKLFPIATEEYPTPAKRPAYSVLSNEKSWESFGLRLPHWEQALSLCLADYSGPQKQDRSIR